MNKTIILCCLSATLAVLPAAAGAQAPLLHYAFSEGGAPATTENIGMFMPGPSPLIGHVLAGTGPNGTPCLIGVAGPANQVTTPFNVNLGNNSWTLGFAVSSNNPMFQYLMSEDLATGWRIFTDGAAGAGNIRMTGGGMPNVDIPGGAGASGWVHVAWVHDTVANQIRGYLDGVLMTTVAAASVNLNSGMPLIIGRLGTTGLGNNNRIDEFRLYDYPLTAAQIAAWSASAQITAPVDFTAIKLSEVSWGDPDGVEITNFSPAAINLTHWRVRWRDSTGTKVSDPLNVSIAAGESIVVMESLPIEPVPSGTQVLDRFSGAIGTTSSAITVALCDETGNDVDEVRISDTAGAHPGWSFGTHFRGVAMRGLISGTTGQVGVERIWGLDSNGGTDWTEQPNRSLGRENRSSGPRGTDFWNPVGIKINEIDDSPDYIELYNPTNANFDMANWFLLCSAGQNLPHVVLTIPPATYMAAFSYVVLGDSATPPPELPPGIPYVNVGAIPWTSGELDCVLYDSLGFVEDAVRVPRVGSTLVHNHPRAPSYWSDFVGAAGRNANGGDDAIGRGPSGSDTNDGGDWFPIYTRTMGSANVASSQAGPAGHDDVIDVRLNETGLGQGFQAILNAGTAPVAQSYNFLVSLGHNSGMGPFFGLGPDALANLPTFYNVPPFSGLLDAQGSARIEFNPGTLPPGLDADFIFVLQFPTGAVSALTYVLAFDT